MKTRYIDIVEQTYEWPQAEFKLTKDATLQFHDLNLVELIEQYGTPMKITYLPIISQQIKRAKNLFREAMEKVNYQGEYTYCYCTKSNHFSFVLEEALTNDIHIETSSAYDMDIIEKLHAKGSYNKKRFIICNGYKLDSYLQRISSFIDNGYENVISVLDNKQEIIKLLSITDKKVKVGIRIASEEAPKFDFYTSRLGLGYKDIVPYYKQTLKDNEQVELKMLHFFINTGISDTAYYWNELVKSLKVYCELKKICPSLDSMNIGGGLPIKNSLGFNYDYEYMIDEIVNQIKKTCDEHNVPTPNIFTEFGSFTVGQSGATLFKVVNQKQQNDRERWNMIDSSFMTTMPDAWAISQRFIMLPINNWDKEYERVFLGGLTCDSDDFYNSEVNSNAIYLPKYHKGNDQYIGFFHTGAYQESIGGFGGVQHCLTPSPKHIVVSKDQNGKINSKVFSEQQTSDSMLKILGY